MPSPPPMTTASTSRTFCTDATPAPSASIASSTSLTASGSLRFSARSQMPLISRVRSRSSMILKRSVFAPFLWAWRARRSLDARPPDASLPPRRPQPPRSPPPRPTTGPTSPAGPPADPHDDVADLAGGAAAGPRPAAEHDAAADAGAPEHAEQRVVRPARAELELRVGGDLDVVAEMRARAERVLERRAERELALPVREVPRARDRAGPRVDVARRADAHARQRVGLDARLVCGLGHRRGHRGGDVVRPALGRRRVARLAEHGVARVHHDRLDLRPAEVDAAAGSAVGSAHDAACYDDGPHAPGFARR